MYDELENYIQDEHGPIAKIDSDTVGMAHDIYFLKFQDGREMVLKVSDGELDFRFEREPYVLEELADRNLSVPEVIEFEINREEKSPSYVLMENVDGQNINSYSEGRKFKYLPEKTKEKIVKNAAKELVTIHEKTSYQKFGAFRSEMKKEYESDEWGDTLLQILRKNELGGIKQGEFSHLYSEAENFLERQITQLNTESRPLMVHQDFSFKNMMVEGDEIKAVIDWERAISGHRELDLFKFERSIMSKFRTKKFGEKYGDLLIEEYNSIRPLESGWEERREIYMLISLIQTMWTFEEWSRDFPEKIKEAIKENMEKEFNSRVNGRKTDMFQHMD